MGQMKRAEERERLLRTKLGSSHAIVITWRTDEHVLLVNFLDPRSRLPLTRQRVFHSKETLHGLVERSMTPLGGPRKVFFEKSLLVGRGEIEVEVSGEQYVKLKGS